MSTFAPNYRIRGSILADVSDAKHDFRGKQFLVDNAELIDMDTSGNMNLSAKLGMTVHSDATMSVDADALLKIGSATDTDFKNVAGANTNSNVRLMTGASGAWEPTGQSLYYADASGILKMLAQPTSAGTSSDAATQILACVQDTGNLEWKDAEAASLHCLGLTTLYGSSPVLFDVSGSAFPPLASLKYSHGHQETFGPILNSSGVQKGYTDSSYGRMVDVAGSAGEGYFYFKAHQSGNYNFSTLVEITNQQVENDDTTIDVSGERTLEVISAVPSGSDNDVTATSMATLFKVTKQPNPDSDIPTEMAISTSLKLVANEIVGLKVGTDSGPVRACLRKFDVHYICDM